MRFADPLVCPDCRGSITGETSCSHCGLDLTSAEVRQLWQTLLQADELLTAAQQLPRAATATTSDPAPAPAPEDAPEAHPETVPETADAPVADEPPTVSAPPTPPEWRPYPAQAAPVPVAAEERSWSVGTILLVLGAFGLIVAALIFVTRSWNDIGLTGRTLILLGVTALIGAVAVWVTRRTLRASAEAMWTVFLTLLTVDFFAARHEDLFGVGALDIGDSWLVWGLIALGLSVGIAVWARPLVGAALVAPAITGGFAITIAGIGAGALGDDWDFAWRSIVALVVAGLMALATRPARLAPMTLVVRIVFAGFYAAAYAAALVEIADHPAVGDLPRHGSPLLLMAVASLVVALLVPVARTYAVALAVLGVSGLGLAPVADAGGEDGAWAVVAVVAVVLAAAGIRGDRDDDWMRGVRLAAVPAIFGAVLLQVVLLADVLETIGRTFDDAWGTAWDVRLDAPSVDNHAAWLVPIVLVGLLATTWCVSRWPELVDQRRHAPAAVGAALALTAVTSVVALHWPVWAVAFFLLVVAAALTALRARRSVAVPTLASALLVVAASALAAASQGVSATTWIVGGVLLLVLAVTDGLAGLRAAYASLSVGLLLGGAAALSDLIGLDGAAVALVVVVVALLLMAAAQVPWRERPASRAVEIAAAVGLLVALVTPGSPAEIAVRWTIAGVGLIALSFAAAGRRWLLWPGVGALVVAYVSLIIDSGFSFVEAYTLPLGAAALAVGLVLSRKKPDLGTWTLLGPGLALALLPSVPQSLAEPTELRALLLGAGALVVLAVGIKLGWQAPFVAGVSILSLLVLFNIGPYANAAPRVVLIAALGAISMGLGITWEDRVRDGRRLATYVRSMR